MNWLPYALLVLLAVGITGSAVYAFFWASKHGQLRNFDAQARSIFDEKEPEGMQTDFFPGQRPEQPGAGGGLSRHSSGAKPDDPGPGPSAPATDADRRSRNSFDFASRHQS